MTTGANKRIDWDEVKRWLHESQLALEKTLETDPDRVEEIYARRAAHLAARRTQAETPVAALRVLAFTLGTDRYALEFADVREILPFVACTPVPTGPPELLGVVNVGGEIRSVLDLGRMLGLPAAEAIGGGYLLLVRFQGREAVLRVDGLENSQLLAPEELVPLGDGEASPSSRYVTGLGPNKVRVLGTKMLLAHPVFNRRELPDEGDGAKTGESRRV